MIITVLMMNIKYKYNDMHKDLATKMFITTVFYKTAKIKKSRWLVMV